jgi:DNA-binding protein H-NS
LFGCFDNFSEEMNMATYKELKAQAEELMRQAEAARKAETAAAIAEVKAKMQEYGITLADLGGAVKAGKIRKAVAAQFRNPTNGDTWSGRGRVPRWLVALESAGHKREEFAV